jgi:hypothetical protein
MGNISVINIYPVDVNKSVYGATIESMYSEMQEYLITIPPNISGNELIIALFFCSNIPTVDSIVRRVKSYDGVRSVELFIITKLVYHQEWLQREIDKRLRTYSRTTNRLPAPK